VELRLLGPLERVGDDGRLIELPAGKPRVVLALLLVDAGRVVSVDRRRDTSAREALRPSFSSIRVILSYQASPRWV
jgi:DNA-binding SARP family transcriptional activator